MSTVFQAREDTAHVFIVHLSDSTVLTLAVEPNASAPVQRQVHIDLVKNYLSLNFPFTVPS